MLNQQHYKRLFVWLDLLSEDFLRRLGSNRHGGVGEGGGTALYICSNERIQRLKKAMKKAMKAMKAMKK